MVSSDLMTKQTYRPGDRVRITPNYHGTVTGMVTKTLVGVYADDGDSLAVHFGRLTKLCSAC